MTLRFVVNNSPRVIYGNYRENSTVRTVQLRPGLNRVETSVLDKLLGQSRFMQLVDAGTISKAPGDVSMALDVEAAVQAGEGSTHAPPPELTDNQREAGLRLARDQASAVSAARKQDNSEAQPEHG